MSAPWHRRRRDEEGAVAVMVGVLAILIFASAAIAVDLGSLWARRGQVQTQVDVAAVAAGDLLPATDAAGRLAVAGRVANYLNRAENRPLGQDPVAAPALLDGAAGNGELAFSSDGHQVTVTAPTADVTFTFAGAVGLDGSTDVTAKATVGVFSELPQARAVLPFFLPNGCPYGPADGDTSNGGGSSSGVTSTASPGTGVVTGGTFSSTAQPDTANQFESRTITFRVTGVSALRSNKAPTVQFQKRDNALVRWAVPGTWTSTSGSQVWEFTAVIGAADVTLLSGQWRYQTVATSRTGNRDVLSSEENFNVQPGSPTTPVVGSTCTVGQTRGNFGQLDSPRNPVVQQHQTNLAVNIAEGLDHQLTVRRNAPADECTDPPRTGEQLDSVSRPGNNCVKADSGNDGPAISDGLLKGAGGYLGRLNAQRGATRAGCNGGNASVGGVTVNNDLLSCYLLNPATPVSALTLPAPLSTTVQRVVPILDPAVTRSPRFVWLPVVYRGNRGSKNFQPVRRFVPAFITDESLLSTRLLPTATADNGVTCNGNRAQCNSVSSLKVFTFDPSWLPRDMRAPVTTYDPATGRKAWRLIG